jgi:hypothetical protein
MRGNRAPKVLIDSIEDLRQNVDPRGRGDLFAVQPRFREGQIRRSWRRHHRELWRQGFRWVSKASAQKRGTRT